MDKITQQPTLVLDTPFSHRVLSKEELVEVTGRPLSEKTVRDMDARMADEGQHPSRKFLTLCSVVGNLPFLLSTQDPRR